MASKTKIRIESVITSFSIELCLGGLTDLLPNNLANARITHSLTLKAQDPAAIFLYFFLLRPFPHSNFLPIIVIIDVVDLPQVT